jgi:hypothetical protein
MIADAMATASSWKAASLSAEGCPADSKAVLPYIASSIRNATSRGDACLNAVVMLFSTLMRDCCAQLLKGMDDHRKHIVPSSPDRIEAPTRKRSRLLTIEHTCERRASYRRTREVV